MSSVAKIVELVGCSKKSWEDAVKVAVTRAGKTIRGIKGVDVLRWTGVVNNNQVVEYRATVKVSFGVE